MRSYFFEKNEEFLSFCFKLWYIRSMYFIGGVKRGKNGKFC